jgi:hypothetical protein
MRQGLEVAKELGDDFSISQLAYMLAYTTLAGGDLAVRSYTWGEVKALRNEGKASYRKAKLYMLKYSFRPALQFSDTVDEVWQINMS